MATLCTLSGAGAVPLCVACVLNPVIYDGEASGRHNPEAILIATTRAADSGQHVLIHAGESSGWRCRMTAFDLAVWLAEIFSEIAEEADSEGTN